MSDHLQRAVVLLNLGRWDQAEEEARRALAEYPDNSDAHRILAKTLGQRGHLEEAQEQAEEAIRLQPESDDAHYTLGWILADQQQWEAAEAALREAIRLDPQDARYFAQLAHTFQERLRWEESVEAARRGLRVDPTNTNCANLLVQAFIVLNRLDEAQEVLTAAMARNPENHWAHVVQGVLHQIGGQSGEALEHFREAARINPENTPLCEFIESRERVASPSESSYPDDRGLVSVSLPDLRPAKSQPVKSKEAAEWSPGFTILACVMVLLCIAFGVKILSVILEAVK